MPITLASFLQIDLPAMLAALLATVSCGLLGNFLVLRRQSLMGDAISHAVLPGIVLAFLFWGSRATWPMFFGAACAGVLAAVIIELVRRLGRLDSGTAMGVVFSVFFAGGVVLMEQAAAHAVDLDADCVLYGQLEDILWLAPTGLASLLEPAVWADMPREVTTLALTLAVVSAVVLLFYKELKLTSFDPELATTLGFPAGLFNVLLMVLVAAVAVAAFEAVGSILVIAMFICPAAAARLFTDRLGRQIWLSLGFAVVAALGGYLLAASAPLWAGVPSALAASGMIAVVAGALLGVAVLFAPRYGALARAMRLGELAEARERAAAEPLATNLSNR
ncbi:metal ABC transporter permease [Marinimicrococcus flavescens]|uniref:Metal ABC transporter permease n=1 Tax=Marinimicrococcus flavescens TaxID=3031815 RepID=A0AAP3XQ43_9PROT|nr:metal ABC transporter permease [Marinimicrococcus flavescens]